MDKTILIPIITGILTLIGTLCGAGLIQFLITRKDKIAEKKNEVLLAIEEIKKDLVGIKQGNIRQQLLFLIKLYPERQEEIITVAKKYFVDFHSNWYLTNMFAKYLDDNKLTYPIWFNPTKFTNSEE